jgi:hypothetical protein
LDISRLKVGGAWVNDVLDTTNEEVEEGEEGLALYTARDSVYSAGIEERMPS